MNPHFVTFLQNAGLAMVLGMFIGAERQMRNSVAGLRTNTLVSLGAAMFVMIETLLGIKDARVAAQVVSGIGFIGGGAILREGTTVRGVSTAATLWCSAAVGALCGNGMISEAAVATGFILVANLALAPLSHRLGTPLKLRLDVETHYALQFTCSGADEVRLRRMLASEVQKTGLVIQAVQSQTENELVRVRTTVLSEQRADHVLERIVETLSDDAGVRSIEWQASPQNPHE